MTKFINRLDNNTIAYNQLTGKNVGIVFLSGFNSDMQGKKALYLEKWAKENNHSFLRFDYSGHGQSSGTIDKTCFSDWYQDAEYLINKLTQDKQILDWIINGCMDYADVSKTNSTKNFCNYRFSSCSRFS